MGQTFDIRKYKNRLEENSVWYSGVDTELRKFYITNSPNHKEFTSDQLNYFWTRNSEVSNVRAVHSGVPQLICEKMVDLLVGNGYSIKIKQDETITDESNQKRLENILQENEFHKLLQEAIETESWSGGASFKLSIHKYFNVPIIELIQPEAYEPVVLAGRIIEDVFNVFYEIGKQTYKLSEIYGADNEGAYIRYKLYIKNTSLDSIWEEVSLDTIPQTQNLKEFRIPGIKKKLSIYKPNKLPNSEFRGSKLGESDYSGSYGAFDALDEILSTWIQEFRDAKINKFWPETMLPMDENSKLTLPSQLKKDFIMFSPGISQEAQSQTGPVILQAELNTEKHESAMKKWMELILNNAGQLRPMKHFTA